ncbi:MAG TPA: bacillithiol biosynthesis cysteine-adding enzyme BshC, partial [Symbiobacteriaceae bacterium]|nr:bacillithiol biosynthesis cysteine-adding enzyme BshC [Symbiobacteriaceae bacterium]
GPSRKDYGDALMRIEPVSGVRLSNSPAVEAFLFDFEKVAPAYEYNWSRQESFAARAAYLNGGGYRGDRAALAAALTAYNQALGAGPSTFDSIRKLAEESALAVVTGQQAGIFTGPAYSIYKAMTAIRLARLQTERLGVPVVPVFWVAGEDHDWHEVSWILTPAGDSVERVALQEHFEGDRRSVALAPAPESLPEAITAFLALLPDTEFKEGVAERIRAAAEAAPALDPALTDGRPTLADWFARLITWLFAGTGLVVVNSADPAIRRLEASFFARAIRQHEEVGTALAEGYALCDSLGFKATVERQLGNINLFMYAGGQRLPIMGAGAHFWLRDQEESGWSTEELVDMALSHPERFSTNVVLRPVVQGALFPDLALVGGPGEISYFGLYRQVFRAMGQQMPIVYPRESFTLVEPPLARILEKQGLTLADAFLRLEEKKQELLEREDRLGIPELFSQFRANFDELYGQLVDKVLLLDANLRFVTEENRKQIAVQIGKLEEKARQQHRKNCEVAIRQFDRLKGQLTPGGLQERSVSFLPYMAKYGPDLVGRLLEETEFRLDGWEHRAVYLGT